jgi:hypothetical protein
MAPGVVEIVAGKNEREQQVVSVLVKRSYAIGDGGEVVRCERDDELRMIDDYYDHGDPEWSTVQYEYELAPYKPAVDVVVIGKAYAPQGNPAPAMRVSVQVADREKSLLVFGDRECQYRESADPVFSDPEPFSEMEIRYERAYGGRDETSIREIPFHYPRNPMGKGVALRNIKEVIDGLALPNIEAPDDVLTPERIVIGEPERWHLQPLPQGFGWRQRTWYPRCALLGSYPAFTEVGTVTAEEQMGLLPPDHIALARQFKLPSFEAHFNNGASLGMIFRTLAGDEEVILRGLTPDGLLQFALPGETPRIGLDFGHGERELESRLHTVSIRPDERKLDLIWRGAHVYEGYAWWAQVTRLSAQVD